MKKILLILLLFATQSVFAQYTLPVDFESTDGYSFTDFGGASSEVVVDPTDPDNKVVRTVKPATAEGWAGTTLGSGQSFSTPIPFTPSSTTMSVRVWSPIPNTRVLLKVEQFGNADRFVETEAYTTTAEQWETLVFDFSKPGPNDKPLDYATNYNLVSIFFNFLAVGAPDLTFYWDDLDFGGDANGGGSVESEVITLTFEENIEWGPFFTNFDGGMANVIANPDPSGINTSANVGRMVKDGGQPWGGAYFDLDVPLYLTALPEATIKVWSPRADATLLFKVENSTNPAQNIEVSKTIGVANEWVELKYDFSAGNLENYYDRVVLIFDLGTIGDGSANFTWYFDDISVNVVSTGDGGENGGGEEDGISLPVTFEEDVDWSGFFTNFDGGLASVVSNPDPSGINTSGNVGQMIKDGGQPWGGAYFTLAGPMDLAATPIANIKVWSPRADATLLFKIENSANPAQNFELSQTIGTASEWVELHYDLSAANLANPYDRVVLIFDLGTTGDGSANFTWYFDDIALTTSTSTDFISELPASTVLRQNYPNPFNPVTQIRYDLAEASDVSLDVYSVVGQHIATIANGAMQAGSHNVSFDASSLSSGVYIVRLRTNNSVQTIRMTLVK